MKWQYDWQKCLRRVYFHADFDGVVSAAMLLRWSLTAEAISLCPVDYHLKPLWGQQSLPPWSAVVDFLYHPDAYLWIDHHANPFVLPEWAKEFRSGQLMCWSEGAPCCPVVIQGLFGSVDSSEFFREYAFWSSIVDSGAYRSPQEATDLKNPYLLASRVIGMASEAVQAQFPQLIARLSIDEVLQHQPDVVELVEAANSVESQVRQRLVDMLEFDGSVVLFDQSEYAWPYQRYHPYLVYPDAAFVVGIYAKRLGFEVSVGANPWKAKPAFHLGRLCESFGGGGHAQVGGVTTNNIADAQRVAQELRRAVKIGAFQGFRAD